MIVTDVVATFVADVTAWGRKSYAEREVLAAVSSALGQLAVAQASGTLEATDATRAMVVGVLKWARQHSYEDTARHALSELGYSEFLPVDRGEFNIKFAGITLQLTLPVDLNGKPYGVEAAVARALSVADVTPVEAEQTETPAA